jgi:hypothetical protein
LLFIQCNAVIGSEADRRADGTAGWLYRAAIRSVRLCLRSICSHDGYHEQKEAHYEQGDWEAINKRRYTTVLYIQADNDACFKVQ